jgi:hypothetical protein
MGPLIVVAADEVVELYLLLEEALGCGSGGLEL